MVNQVLLTYLRTYKSKYNIGRLKAKILSNGYSEKDYEEAMGVLNKESNSIVSKPLIKEQIPPISSVVETMPDRIAPGNKWIKASAIIGFILSVLFIVLALLGYADISWREGIFGNVLLGGLFLLFCFYLFGFMVVGKNNKLKWLKISSLLFLVSVALCLISIFGIFSYSGMLLIGEGELGSIGLSMILLFLLLGFSIFLGIVSRIIFSISLIKNKENIKFGGLAGAFGLCAAVFSILFILVVLYLTIFPRITSEGPIILFFKIVFQFLVILTLVFESIVLWKASNV